MRKLPHSIIVGAPKCGTTTLCAALSCHPNIFLVPGKETHFFNWYYESRGLRWYESLFKNAPQGAHLLEGTPDYSMSNWVDSTIARISQEIPDVKLIYMVRDPIKRIESHYSQAIANGKPAIGINQAVQEWPEIIKTSRYTDIYERILRRVPSDRVHVVFLEDYQIAPRSVHKDVLGFLGLDATSDVLNLMAETKQENTRGDQAMDSPLLAKLRGQVWFNSTKERIPKSILSIGKYFLRRPVSVEISWDPSLREMISRDLTNDWLLFSKKHGRILPETSVISE